MEAVTETETAAVSATTITVEELCLLGTLYLNGVGIVKKDQKTAYYYYQRALDMDPKSPRVFNCMGDFYRTASDYVDYNKALLCYRAAYTFDPNDPTTLSNLGHMYSGYNNNNQIEYKTAREYLERAIERDPEHVNALAVLGKMYTIDTDIPKDYTIAVKLLSKAVKIEPLHNSANYTLGVLYKSGSGVTQCTYTAYDLLLCACMICPTSEACMNLASMLRREIRQYVVPPSYYGLTLIDKLAIKYLKKAIMCDPKHVNSLAMLGEIHEKNNKTKAFEYYNKVLEINPKHSGALKFVTAYFKSERDLENALKYYLIRNEDGPERVVMHNIYELYMAIADKKGPGYLTNYSKALEYVILHDSLLTNTQHKELKHMINHINDVDENEILLEFIDNRVIRESQCLVKIQHQRKPMRPKTIMLLRSDIVRAHAPTVMRSIISIIDNFVNNTKLQFEYSPNSAICAELSLEYADLASKLSG